MPVPQVEALAAPCSAASPGSRCPCPGRCVRPISVLPFLACRKT